MKISTVAQHWFSLSMAGVWLASCVAVCAERLVRIEFQGVIQYVDDMSAKLGGTVTNGLPISGFYTFDADQTDSNAASDVGDYRFTNRTAGVVVKVGDRVFHTNPARVDVLIETVNRATDNFLVRSYNNLASDPALSVSHIAWQLDDSTGSAITSDQLPDIAPILSKWQQIFALTIEGGGGPSGYFIRATITNATPSSLSIPASPDVQSSTALELRFATVLGEFYRVEKSTDLITWQYHSGPFVGTGVGRQLFISTSSGTARTYFRVTSSKFP